jgi:transposase-like protein
MKNNKPKYTPEFKKEVCDFALFDNITNAAKFHKVDRDTVGRWVKNYKLLGEKIKKYYIN